MPDFSEAALRFELDNHLKQVVAAIAGSIGETLPVAWEDLHFSPVVGQNYLAAQMSARTDNPIAYYQGGTIQADGNYQINVVTPAGRSPYVALKIIDALKPHWARGRTFTMTDGHLITLGLRQVPKSYQDGSWVRQPFIVPFTVYAQA